MIARIVFGSIVIMSLLAVSACAEGKGDLKGYISDAATRAKATSDPAEKRQILDESFQGISRALDVVKGLPFISKDDIAGIDRFKSALQEKQFELAGTHGYVRVADVQLNAFTNYVVQEMEQADEMITISVVTLLIILLVILILL